ncbi:MAG: GTP pyrophosphokinase family protein [Agathobacter sp.]
MYKINNEDKMYRQMLMTNVDEDVLRWAQEKGMDLQRLMTYYKCAILEIETKLRVLDEEYSLQHDRNPINTIKTRLKSIPSIMEKLERKNIEVSLPSIEQNLNDIAGIRVVCSFIQDVYTIAEALLKQDDITLVEKKDYIKNPKENGYRSLHLIVEVPIFLEKEKRSVKVEIQLRTIAMDCWASLEHQLRYKKEIDFTTEMQNELLECAKLSVELDSRMDALRNGTKL